MKMTKKVLAILLAFAMLATTLCLPAFAVESTGNGGNDAVQITDAAGLLAMEADGNYVLANDIQLSAPLNVAFSGTLDGAGKTITFTSALANSSALFSTLSGTVKNLNVGTEDAHLTMNYSGEAEVCYGVIANEVTASATLTNVHLWADVVYTDCAGVVSIGGFFGSVNPSAESTITVENCSMNGTMISGTKLDVAHKVGGFIGLVQSENVCTVKFDSCVNNAEITDNSTAKYTGIGGFIGEITNANATLEMTDCVNTGDVSSAIGKSWSKISGAGGFVGLVNAALDLTIKDSENKSALITSPNFTGGFLGCVYSVDDLKIEYCVNYATVEGAQVGGMIGRNIKSTTASVSHCVNYGKMISATRAGGIVGVGAADTGVVTIDSCINVGTVMSLNKSAYVHAMYGSACVAKDCVTFTKPRYYGTTEQDPENGCTFIGVTQTNVGAGVRIVNDDKGTALRFKFTMDTASVTALQALVAMYGAGNVQVGAIILPTAQLQTDVALTAENYSDALIVESNVSDITDGYYYALIESLYAEKYNTAYSCQSFCRFKTSADGEWITVYANNTLSRTVADVADAALADPRVGYTAEQRALLDVYSAANN